MADAGDPYAFFDHSPIIGRSNPLAPPLDLGVTDGRVVGSARFGSAYEGPPGAVHGGYVAAAFDEVLGAGQLFSGEDLTAEAEAIFVTVDFAQMMARRADGAAPPPSG